MKILENFAVLKCSISMFYIDCEDLALDMVKNFFSLIKIQNTCLFFAENYKGFQENYKQLSY
jgi:hypothetical protein